jgi:hypothetical protein
MILVYSEIISERLKYIAEFIFGEQLGVSYILTDDLSDCEINNCFLINYSHKKFTQPAFTIKPSDLLFENDIRQQEIVCHEEEGTKYFFKTTESDFHFDVLSASFYLISRYEEYLPHEKDNYGRYDHQHSLAYKNNFLNKPMVNIWLKEFTARLLDFFPELKITTRKFRSILSYDIDIAWSYKNKGFIRNLGGFLKKPTVERIKVLLGLQDDPYDSYNWLIDIHHNENNNVIYFFPMAEKNISFDKNISPENRSLQNQIKSLAKSFAVGLHPSWRSFSFPSLIKKEKEKLESIIHKEVIHSRQHYIKFELPNTFQNLIDAGIRNEYSMGYGSINGFRASVASDYFWYDLSHEEKTELRLFPFCFMDANSFYEQHQNAEKSFEEIVYYKNICAENNGLFISIFHNNFLGTDKQFKGWREMYERVISQVL